MTTFVGTVGASSIDAKDRILALIGDSFNTKEVPEMTTKLRSSLDLTLSILNDLTPAEVDLRKLRFNITPSYQGEYLSILLSIATLKAETFKTSTQLSIAVEEDGSFDSDELADFILGAYEEIVQLRCSEYNGKLVEEALAALTGESGIKLAFVVSPDKAPRDINSILEDGTVELNTQDLGVEANGTILDDIVTAVAKDKDGEDLTSYEITLLENVREDFASAENIVSFLASWKEYLHPYLASKTGKMAVNNAKGYFLRSYSSKFDWLEKVSTVGRTAKVEEKTEGDEVVETHITLFERREAKGELVQVLPTFVAETKLFV